MVYNTTEAYIENSKIIFTDNSFKPKAKTRVLVTFIDDELDDNLYELENSKITKSLLDGSQKVLKKDKSLFTNI